MTSEEGASGGMEDSSMAGSMPVSGTSEPAQMTEAASTGAPQSEGRRTQLRIVREGVENLRTDVWKLTRNHESRTNKLEAQIKSLRAELATHARSKEVEEQVKKHAVSSKKLEKDVANLRAELAGLKSGMAKDAARTRANQEVMFSRILSKVSAKPKVLKPKIKAKAKRR